LNALDARQPQSNAKEKIVTGKFLIRALLIAACAGLMGGCGGGDNPPPPQPVVGAAGGTVAGPNGAQVVVPAGALAANTAIAVDQSSSGAPALPAGVNALGSMFAFTPHGTTFAVPVTITVPFNAGSLPAGATPLLYKTNAAGAWEQVANASVNAGTISAQVSSFSWLIVGNLPPQITAQPADVAVVEPATASFSVTALGTPPFTYQWQRSDNAGAMFDDIAGATTGSYTTGATSVAADNGDRYRVLVSNLEGTTTSSAATLTVTANVVLPTITTQPQSLSVAPGANASFSVVATGSNLVYQWQKNGAPIAGQTNASLNLANVQALDAASYTVVVSNLVNGSAINGVTSNAATLTVGTTLNLTGIWISNFQCTGTGGNFPGQDTLTVTQTGTAVTFTSQPDEGTFTGTLSGNTMTYSGGGPGYTESGAWTIQDANNFTKTSNYTRTDGSGGGSCPGTGQRQ
jgi:hypothetical protein